MFQEELTIIATVSMISGAVCFFLNFGDHRTNFETIENTITFTVDSSNFLVYPFNRIQSLPSGEFDEIHDLGGKVAMPGMINANHHLNCHD